MFSRDIFQVVICRKLEITAILFYGIPSNNYTVTSEDDNKVRWPEDQVFNIVNSEDGNRVRWPKTQVFKTMAWITSRENIINNNIFVKFLQFHS